MKGWTPAELAEYKTAHLRRTRLCQARNAPPASLERRVALVAFERGLTDRQLEQFYYVNRKGAKKRHFDTKAFAEKYGVDVHWLWDGDLCAHPRGLTRKQTPKGGRWHDQPQGGDAA
jgi:hypothetical protein